MTRRDPKIRTRMRGWVAALALVAVAAAAPAGDMLQGLHLKGFHALQMRKTTVLREVRAAMGRMALDGFSVVIETITANVVLTGDKPPVIITSPIARYWIEGPEMPEPADGTEPTGEEVTPEQITAWMQSTREAAYATPTVDGAYKGDILFSSLGIQQQVKVDLGTGSTIEASHLLWSERHQRFVAFGGFRQITDDGEGGRVVQSGGAMIADRTFSEILHRGTDGFPLSTVLESAPAPTGS